MNELMNRIISIIFMFMALSLFITLLTDIATRVIIGLICFVLSIVYGIISLDGGKK